jgi:hypothetical protein
MATLNEAEYYRMQHVTGPGCVLVSLRFGKMPDSGPLVTIRTTPDRWSEPGMDIGSYVAEALDGVSEVNRELGISLEVAEIEVVPDDYPTIGQVRHCAMLIARHVAGSTPGRLKSPEERSRTSRCT